MTVVRSNKSLPDIVRDETGYDGDSNTELFLGELGIGTKVYDHLATIGLNKWMHVNGYADEVDHAVIGGGLLPEYPNLYSKKTNAERFRWIGQDEDKADVPEATRLAELYDMVMTGEKGSEYLEDHVEDWIRGKLASWPEVLDYAHKQMDYLFDDIDVDRVDYCMGEEDTNFNRIEREVKFLKQFKREAESFKEELEEKYEQKQEEYDGDMLAEAQTMHDVLADIHNRVSSHQSTSSRYGNADVERFIYNNILEEQEDGSLDLNDTFKRDLPYDRRQEIIEDVLRASEHGETGRNNTGAFDAYTEAYEEKRDYLNRFKENQRDISKTIDNIGSKLDKLDMELDDELARINSRHKMEAVDPEVLYAATKDEYTEEIKSCFPEEIRDNLETHISRSATVEDVSYGDGENAVLEEAEVDIYGDMMVMHSTKFRSDTTTLFGLKEAERELLYRRMVEKVMTDPDGVIPKHIVVPHGAGGFQATRINTTPEFKLMDEEEYRDDPNLSSITLLPTFQSVDKLIEFKDKGVRNWATKRIDKFLHASGALFHSTLDDGSELYEYVDHASLANLGEKVVEQQEYEEGSREWRELEHEIEDMAARTYEVRATLGDVHIGAANFNGTPSNYERFQRTINYLTEVYGDTIDEVVLTELVDGVLEHTDIAKKFFADTLPDVIDRSAERVKETREENIDIIEQMLDGNTVGDMSINELYDVAGVETSGTGGLYNRSLRELVAEDQLYELEEDDYVTALAAAAEVGDQNLDEWLDAALSINDNWVETHEALYDDVKQAYERSSLPNIDKQFESIDPFLERLLLGTMPRRVTLTSGNHIRSEVGRDEATQLEYMIERYDLTDELEIRKSDSIGSKSGGFSAIKDETVNINGVDANTGKSVAFHHQSPGGTHGNITTLRKILESGYAFDEFFAGHVHHPRIGFTTGVAQTISPACQGPNDYSEYLRAKAALYGTTVKFSNVAPDGDPANDMITHAWHMINDDTLERDEFVDDEFTAEIKEYQDRLEQMREEAEASTN